MGLKKFVAKLTGKKQRHYVDLKKFVGSRYLEPGDWGIWGDNLYNANKMSNGLLKIYEDEENRHIIEFGYYPQRKKMESWLIEELMNPQRTGRSYYMHDDYRHYNGYNHESLDYSKYRPQPEFRLSNGKRVVRKKNFYEKKILGKSVKCWDEAHGYNYYEVEPIKWVIDKDKWKNLSPIINPDSKTKNLYNTLIEVRPLGVEEDDARNGGLMVAPELLKLSGVDNIDYLLNASGREIYELPYFEERVKELKAHETQKEL